MFKKYFRAGSSKFAGREPTLLNPELQSHNLKISNEEAWGWVPSRGGYQVTSLGALDGREAAGRAVMPDARARSSVQRDTLWNYGRLREKHYWLLKP